MTLTDLTSAWDAAVQRALADNLTETELDPGQLASAAGLHLRTGVRAGDGDGPQARPTKFGITVLSCR